MVKWLLIHGHHGSQIWFRYCRIQLPYFCLAVCPLCFGHGAIARETNKSWMAFSILWGLNVAYSLAALFYQAATFSQHPQSSLIIIVAVIIFNLVLFTLLRRARSRVTLNLANQTAKSCSDCSGKACH